MDIHYSSFSFLSRNDFAMHFRNILLVFVGFHANNSCTYTVQLPIMANVKLEPSDDIVFPLSNSDDDVCSAIDLFDTMHFPFRIRTPTQSLVSIHVHITPCSPLCMKLPLRGSPYPCPPLHPSSFFKAWILSMHWKWQKCKRRSKFDLTTIDFDSINVRDIKYFHKTT